MAELLPPTFPTFPDNPVFWVLFVLGGIIVLFFTAVGVRIFADYLKDKIRKRNV